MILLYIAIAPDGTHKTRHRTEFKTMLESLSRRFPDADIVVRCDEIGTDTTVERQSSIIESKLKRRSCA